MFLRINFIKIGINMYNTKPSKCKYITIIKLNCTLNSVHLLNAIIVHRFSKLYKKASST